MNPASSGVGGDRSQPGPGLFERRDQDAGRVVAQNRSTLSWGVGRRWLERGARGQLAGARWLAAVAHPGLFVAPGIVQQDAQGWFAAADHGVGRFALIQLEPMRNQRLDVQPAINQQIQHRFEVALFGPADEANRVVLAFLFIIRVVAAGAIGEAET